MKIELFHGEVAKPIRGYEGLYSVTSHGRVFSHDRIDTAGHRHKGRIITPKNNGKGGYHFVALFNNCHCKQCLIHRLVAETFISNPDGKKEVNHKNFNRKENRSDNLEWSTRLENHRHAVLGGRSYRNRKGRYYGVHLTSDTSYRKRWRAQVYEKGKTKSIGHFATEMEAVYAYNKYVIDNNLTLLLNKV